MTDEDGKRLYDGISALVRATAAGRSALVFIEGRVWEPIVSVVDDSDFGYPDTPPPPLCPIRAFALSVLIDPTTAKAGALVDLLREAGVITGEWEDAVRKDEAGKVLTRFFNLPVNEIHTWPELDFALTASVGSITGSLAPVNLNPVITEIPPELGVE